ncbi:hypothetical protein HNQ94_001889 [Salirhabdus euzebyi]|uniref:Uncharacterized protein n=1 Tax=Salirhabdus euzebyi TaxID=394506 RepID=A0A841Q502_9BACI|nr:hypothetical protein [Salirhabdus euzebyi]MBB6453440.1 hypothetical protein [Salirhabdus euzebyi]
MQNVRQKLFWLIPLIIIVVGLAILYFTNLQRFTEPPSENWSREINVGTADKFTKPIIHVTADNIEIALVEDGVIQKKTYDNTYELLDTQAITPPFTSWTDYYLKGDNIYFFKDGTIINGNNEEVVTEAELFVPVANESKILYTKEQTIFELNMETNKTKEIMTTTHPIKELLSYENYIMAYTNDLQAASVSIYHVEKGPILSEDIELGLSEDIQKILFATDNENLYVGIHSETQGNKNKQTFLYMSQSVLSDPKLNFSRISPYDPVTKGALSGLDQFQLRSNNGSVELLFRAVGFTFKETKENQALNIYLMSLNGNHITTERLSNTYKVSNNPFFINENSIGWSQKEDALSPYIYVTSSNPDAIKKADTISSEEYLIALGMCVAMLSTSVFILYILIIWLTVPIIYLLIISVLKRKGDINFLDRPSVFYGGVLAYLIGAYLFRHHLFHGRYNYAPSFLTFEGSDIVYIIGSALLAFISVLLIKRDWGTVGKYTYFISLQMIIYLLLFGPYYF